MTSRRWRRGFVQGGIAAALVLATGSACLAQAPEETPDWARRMAADPDSPAMKSYAAQQRTRIAVERELRKLRFQHFGSIINVEIRQAGILKMRSYTDPAAFPSLVEIFRDETDDVRRALLDHLADQKSEDADVCLAWIAARDRSAALRAAARDRVAERVRATEKVSPRIAMVVWSSLRSSDEAVIAQGAELASGIGMYEAIPWLIAAQLGSAPTATDRAGNGDLAWIMVGKQVAFVSDLTPVVSDSAVAFDPQVSVVTEGVLLRVHDASVLTYRYEVHYSLIDLSSRGWGRPTNGLGWDQDRWRSWYKDEFLPYRKARESELASDRPAPPK